MFSLPFSVFTENMKKELLKPLPGEIAQNRMAASSRFRVKLEPNDRTRQSAVLILFYPRNGQVFVPLILRPVYDGVHSGQMAFPGGRYELKDKTLIQTALREAQEEIGLRLEAVEVLGVLTKIYIPPSNLVVLPVVAAISGAPEFFPDPREVADIFEFSLDEITDPLVISESEIEVRGTKVKAPHYLLQNQKVWGATAMMISELNEILTVGHGHQSEGNQTG